jgi:predicted nucleic acid-binding protein
MSEHAGGTHVLLDACCLLNLCAAGCCKAVAQALCCTFVIAGAVSSETLYIRREVTVEDPVGREPVDLRPLVDSGTLVIAPLDEVELVTFGAFAQEVDDGEAATLALAICRTLPLATDDKEGAPPAPAPSLASAALFNAGVAQALV